jgi:prepilin-type processing-associated H-X9-DG protein
MQVGHSHRRPAFTLVQLLFILALLGVVVWLLLPKLNDAREKKNRVGCAGNLRLIGIAMLAYAGDHGGYLPTADDNNVDNVRAYWHTALTRNNYVSHRVFQCPTDQLPRTTPYEPRSYAIRVDDTLRCYNPGAVFWIQGSRTNCPLLNSSEAILVAEKVDPQATMSPDSPMEATKSPMASQVVARPQSVHVPGAPFEGNYLFMDGHAAWIRAVEDHNWPNCPATYTPTNQPCP